ncbi:MAG: hypothetical protein RJB32_226 [Actinomycetota bacterium]
MEILTAILAFAAILIGLLFTVPLSRSRRSRVTHGDLVTKVPKGYFVDALHKLQTFSLAHKSQVLPEDNEVQANKPAGALFELDSGEFISNPLNQLVSHALIIGPTGSGKTALAREIGGTFQGDALLVTDFPKRLLRSYDFAAKTMQPAAFGEYLKNEIGHRSQQHSSEPLLVIFDALERSIRNPEFLEQVLDLVRVGSNLDVQVLFVTQQPWLLDKRDLLNFGLRVELSPAHPDKWNRTAESLPACSIVSVAEKQGKLVSLSPARSDYKSEEDVRFASTPLSAPGELCAPSHRSLWGPSSAEEQPEQQDRLGHPPGHKDQRHTRPYSKTL